MLPACAPNLQLRCVPSLELNVGPCSPRANALPAEPNWPGPRARFLMENKDISFVNSCWTGSFVQAGQWLHLPALLSFSSPCSASQPSTERRTGEHCQAGAALPGSASDGWKSAPSTRERRRQGSTKTDQAAVDKRFVFSGPQCGNLCKGASLPVKKHVNPHRY